MSAKKIWLFLGTCIIILFFYTPQLCDSEITLNELQNSERFREYVGDFEEAYSSLTFGEPIEYSRYRINMNEILFIPYLACNIDDVPRISSQEWSFRVGVVQWDKKHDIPVTAAKISYKDVKITFLPDSNTAVTSTGIHTESTKRMDINKSSEASLIYSGKERQYSDSVSLTAFVNTLDSNVESNVSCVLPVQLHFSFKLNGLLPSPMYPISLSAFVPYKSNVKT